jgi:RNA polymerase sigma factor (sigma-70 family)
MSEMTRRQRATFRRSMAGGMSLEEVAKEMGISKQRVQVIEARALAKLKVILQERGMTLESLGVTP